MLDDRVSIHLARVAKWQKYVLWGLALNVGLTVASIAVNPDFALVNVLVGIALIVAVRNLSAALGDDKRARVLYCLCMFVPFVSLLVLVVISQRATRALRAHGISVGLVGARTPPPY